MTSINNADALSIFANNINTAPKLAFTHLFDAGVPLVADSALAKATDYFYTNLYTGNDSLGHTTTDFKLAEKRIPFPGFRNHTGVHRSMRNGLHGLPTPP